MKLTCYMCVANLVILGICGGVYALTGFNLLMFISLNNILCYRVFLAICGVSALFTAYSLIAFKPFKGLK